MFAFTLLYILSLYQKSYRSSFKRKENIYKRGGGSDYVDSVNLTHCILLNLHCCMLDESMVILMSELGLHRLPMTLLRLSR